MQSVFSKVIEFVSFNDALVSIFTVFSITSNENNTIKVYHKTDRKSTWGGKRNKVRIVYACAILFWGKCGTMLKRANSFVFKGWKYLLTEQLEKTQNGKIQKTTQCYLLCLNFVISRMSESYML